MCGIAGIIRFDQAPDTQKLIKGMMGKLSHRGKDHEAVETGSPGGRLSAKANIALGHRRLSIIDLSHEASQPMPYGDSAYWLVYNGEIYNYIEIRQELIACGLSFRTQSDSEVILGAYAEWGEACVEKLNGMFAFALWDEARQKLFCARDQLGVKPFFIYRAATFIAFASESKALSSFHGNRLSQQGVAAYLASSYCPGQSSIFEGVEKLMPGHCMIIRPSGSIETRRYWRPKLVAGLQETDYSVERLRSLTESAVTRQMRSDVPVGALLSGGVDSGMVVALASSRSDHLFTYSAGFEGHSVDELPAALSVAKKYKTFHKERKVSDIEAMIYLDRAVKGLSEPIADPAIIPSFILSEMAASDGVKVLLSGTGGDEVFGGYDRYVGGGTLKRNLLSFTPEVIRQIAGKLLPPSNKLGARLRDARLDMIFNTAGSFNLSKGMLEDEKAIEEFLDRLTFAIPKTIENPHSLLYKQMDLDLSTYLPDEILFLFDQMTMANTVEGRVPLIDIDLAEMALSFPSASHVRGGRTKCLFKKMAEPYLGTDHVWRKKHGFSGPVPYWVNRHRTRFELAAFSINGIPGLENFRLPKWIGSHASRELGPRECNELFAIYIIVKWYEGLSTESSAQGLDS